MFDKQSMHNRHFRSVHECRTDLNGETEAEGWSMGSSQNPWLFLIHGWLGHPDDWIECAERLADSFYCISLPVPVCASLEECVDVLNDMIRSSDPQPNSKNIFALGYSMGGRLLLEYIKKHPHTFNAHIIESGHLGLKDQQARIARLHTDQERAQAFVNSPTEFLDAWYDMPLWGNQKTDALKLKKKHRLSNPDYVKAMASVLTAYSLGHQSYFFGHVDSNKPTSRTRIAGGNSCGRTNGNSNTTKCPSIHFISGEHDQAYTTMYQQACNSLGDNGSTHSIIKHAYHHPHWSHPVATAEAVKAMCKRHRQTTSLRCALRPM